MKKSITPTLHYDCSLFAVDSALLDRVAFQAQPESTTKVWIQLQDGTQQMFDNIRSERVFEMLESSDPDSHYRQLCAWVTPSKAKIDLPKRGLPCSPTMRERTYQGHFKDRKPANPVSPCSLEF